MHIEEHDRALCDGCVIAVLRRLAEAVADGHFTILKFTTNWRVALETPNLDTSGGRDEIQQWATGDTLSEAVLRLLEHHAHRSGR